MKKIGYARVSTKDQNLEMQIEAMKHAGCDKIYMEKKSGRKLKNRPVLRRLLKQSTAGDILIVWKIDRLGRSARELLEVLDIVRGKCMIIISLKEGIDTSTMIGELFFMMAGVFAEMEINGRSERTREGIELARQKGKRIGRPNTGNQRTENFSITISARYSSNSITHYLSGSPSEIQMLTEPHITSVSPSSGISDGYNFVINTDCISINKIMAGIYSSL